MSLALQAVRFDANDPDRLARFWAGLLGREVVDDPDGGVVLPPVADTEFAVGFRPSQRSKVGLNQIHLEVTSTSAEDQQRIVARALQLGGRHLDIGQRADEGHVVLADPEGNELCVIEPGNRFLAGCGYLACVNCEGTQQVGYFWSEALGWPLVWDQDEETAIQSPRGGAKMAWGGPPLRPRTGKNRLHLDLAPPPDGDQQAEIERLIALGARRIDIGQGDVSWVVLADPDGNELCVLTPRSAWLSS
jgi:catechol 2,3-dioxygenase-like lactoylglutathione lyase family enzyme